MYHKLHPSLGIFIYLGLEELDNFLDVGKSKRFSFREDIYILNGCTEL